MTYSKFFTHLESTHEGNMPSLAITGLSNHRWRCIARTNTTQFVNLGPDLRNISRQSHDNDKVTIDLRWTSNLPNTLRRMQGTDLGTIYLQNRKIVRHSARILAYHIPERNLSMLQVTIIGTILR